MDKKRLTGVLYWMLFVLIFGACAGLSAEPVQLPGSQGGDVEDPLEQTESQPTGDINGSGNNMIKLEESGITMRVLWTVSGYQFESGSAVKTSEQAESMLFKPLDIEDTYIVFDGQVCKDIVFETRTVKTSDYLADAWQETPEQLKILDEEIQVFTTNCGIDGFSEYIRQSDGRLIVKIGHTFYMFDPAITY